ncbi:Na+/H+ antiporter subunit G [Niallia nealsonii]|uniref:Na+/H+ antiporter subunit G n=1 Tax=Niallia nealsonii TaxID=115979 RepID=A0A2N0Z2C1_9BACI|nr:Na+/H+ antiporter subunit G [Niallia nealsonii]
MEIIINIITGTLIFLGAALTVVAAFGVIKLPDVYTRNHAASKSATLGIMCILLGTCLYFFQTEGVFNSRLILAIAFIFITSPVAGHLVIRAAYNTNVPMCDHTIRDDLKQQQKITSE